MNNERDVLRSLVMVLFIVASLRTCVGDDAAVVADFEHEANLHRLHPLTGSPMRLELCQFQYLDTNRRAITAEGAKAFVELAAEAWGKHNDTKEIVELSKDLNLNYSPWSRGFFRQTPGGKVRLRLGPIEPDVKYPTVDHSRHGEDSTYYSSDSQQLSHYRGNSGWALIDSTAFFPIARVMMEWCPSQDLGQGLLRFQDPETSSYVDWDTASKVIVRTDMGVGSTRKYSRFTGFTDYPNESTGGVVACPGFVAHAKLKGDNCESLVVYLILSAEFPPVVPDAEFEIPAPVGTTAVLFAPSSMSEVNAVDKVQADRGPVADARTLVPELLAQESENLRRKENLQQATQRTGIRPWFFWANVVGIVLLVVGCVRVSRQRKNGMNTDAKGG